MSSDSLNDILSRTRPAAPKPAPAEASENPEALSIAQMDGTSMRPANKPMTRLHVLDRHGKVWTFQYHFLDVVSRFEGDVFTLTFAGTRHWQVTVKGHGPKFWMAYDFITLHRWPYLREAVRDFGGDDGTVFTEIHVNDVTPEPK